ncbi:HAD family hydrolase [Streptosporangium sp. NPDC001559]|uniref:HAD family hydrolase n=1 Tax=Streptosporangium sp. NPDC001559 TaxID=3366187 RepID=UPI0036F12B24
MIFLRRIGIAAETFRGADMPILVFDLFGVIARHQSRRGLTAIENAAGLSSPEFWRAYWDLRPPYDRDDSSSLEYWQAVARAVGTHFDDGQIERLVTADLESWSEVDEEMVDYVTGMSSRVRLALLSNIPADLAAHFERRHPWLDAFEVRGFSCHIRHAKPEPDAYAWCLKALGVQPSETVFIDDRAENVHAAEAMGMGGHLFTSLDSLRERLGDRKS